MNSARAVVQWNRARKAVDALREEKGKGEWAEEEEKEGADGNEKKAEVRSQKPGGKEEMPK